MNIRESWIGKPISWIKGFFSWYKSLYKGKKW